MRCQVGIFDVIDALTNENQHWHNDSLLKRDSFSSKWKHENNKDEYRNNNDDDVKQARVVVRGGMIIWWWPEAKVAFITRPQLESYGGICPTHKN